jgi:hypothetical protein
VWGGVGVSSVQADLDSERGSAISCSVEGCILMYGGGDTALKCPPPSTEATCAAAAACSGQWAVATCEVDALAAAAAEESRGGGGGGCEFCLLFQ